MRTREDETGRVWRGDEKDVREREGGTDGEMEREIKRNSSSELMLTHDNEAFRNKRHH